MDIRMFLHNKKLKKRKALHGTSESLRSVNRRALPLPNAFHINIKFLENFISNSDVFALLRYKKIINNNTYKL